MDTVLEKNVRNSVGIVPARMESTRLPNKLLLDLDGKPVLQWTLEGASTSKFLSRLIVATDSNDIAEFCASNGFDFVITPKQFFSGTERVLWAYKHNSEGFAYVVNIQGDEPFIDGEIIDNLLLQTFQKDANISTIIAPIDNQDELFNPSTVKVVTDLDSFALYFSRNVIPYIRDKNESDWMQFHQFFKHIGIYCFTHNAIDNLAKMPIGKLEIAEKLEQLRWLENGEKILCVKTNKFLVGIDTKDDLEIARKHIKNLPSKSGSSIL